MKTRKKQVKAQRMWTNPESLEAAPAIVISREQFSLDDISVAILCIDDPDALVKQVVKAIAKQPLARDQYADARAVLESLGILPKNRAKKGTK